jgi:glycine oxidase
MPDVVVIGGGIIGCAVAETLSAIGAAVLLVDPRSIGAGATHASGGMLVPHTEGVHAPTLEALGVRSLALYDEFVDRVSAAAGLPVVYARTGSLHAAFDEAEAAELETLASAHAARGVPCSLLPGPDARQLERELAADCVRALVVPAHGFVGALGLAKALWTAAASRGARAVQATVHHIVADRGRVRVESDAGMWTALHAVLAAGSWTQTLVIEGADALPVRPIRGQLLHLRWPTKAMSRIVWGARAYLVPWPDGTVLVGATSEEVGFDERATVTGVRALLESAAELVPSAWQAEFVGVRVGLRPASPDELPIVGRSERVPGLVYATGHYRNGVLLAPLTAELVAKAIAGEQDPALAVTSPARFGSH